MNLPESRSTADPAPPQTGKIAKHHLEEWRGKAYVYLCVLLLVVIIFSIVVFIASRGLTPFISQGVSIKEMLFGLKWAPEDDTPVFGALPFLVGSFSTSLIAALIAAPLGICASIFMTEIMPKTGKSVLQPAIELLAGIPSVVYGFVGLSVIVPFLRHTFPGQGVGIMAGAIVLSVMILPTITSIATDALRSLPAGLKEGSYALGATRWQTIARIILPTTMPALLTGVVLGIARAFGEALAVQMVIGNAPHIPHSLFESATTLTSIITLSMGNTTTGSLHNNALWSLALILLIMTFLFVFIVRLLERRVKRS
ncbi:phosphate ABC transporter permease subunit PstC [Cohnella nanjingensis]|uniref:Phosphate transport system permease protein n=1 Tax=Cohnella nanjingensis TaxID=1387779 RepID=A0A7X0RNX9_9BACL|nr:phosphate ABC transporter permease subunit PstC [Cohnella nanjingensis]MBB6671013.1 phosphate ABC transporter permease subunit PstC [Cohnella nanjingensis]